MGKNNKNDWCRLPFALLSDNRLNLGDAALYAVLLDKCTDSFTCQCNISDLAIALGVSLSSIKRSANQLERCGYLMHQRTGRDNIYILTDVIGLKRKKSASDKSASALEKEEVSEGQQELKMHYGKHQHVCLTADECYDLAQDFGDNVLQEYIQRMDMYCEDTGKRYSDCAAKLRIWITQDMSKNSKKNIHLSASERAEVEEYMSVVNQF